LRELYEDLDISAYVTKKRWECTGHVARMDQGGRFKRIFENKPEESRIREDLE